MHVLFVWPRPSLGTFICVQVEKRHADSLTFSEFFFQYALTHTPVVITGLVGHMTPTPWTLDYIKTVCCHTNTHGTETATKPLIFALKWLWYQFTMKCTSQMYNASFSPLSAKFFFSNFLPFVTELCKCKKNRQNDPVDCTWDFTHIVACTVWPKLHLTLKFFSKLFIYGGHEYISL